MMTRMTLRFRRFRKDEEGVSTANFVVLFSLMISVFFGFFEAGWLMTRWVMLDRGVDAAVREVRLGYSSGMTHDQLRGVVCEHSDILRNCTRDLILEVVPMNIASSYPQNQANCTDRTGAINPVISFDPGAADEVMFIRACMVIDPIFPGLEIGLMLPKDSSGGFQMVSYTAFLNEPI